MPEPDLKALIASSIELEERQVRENRRKIYAESDRFSGFLEYPASVFAVCLFYTEVLVPGDGRSLMVGLVIISVPRVLNFLCKLTARLQHRPVSKEKKAQIRRSVLKVLDPKRNRT